MFMNVLDSGKLSLFRKYYLETSVIVLALALGFTVNFVIRLNDNFFKFVLEANSQNIIQIQKTTEALNRNTEALQENTTEKKEQRNQFNKNKN